METKKTRRQHIKYSEGQWFAVPLKNGGYALGIIVRGNYKTKGGLGYFFAPRYESIPDNQDTWQKQPSDAIMIAWFGDLGLIWGTWPLIPTTRPFRRQDWTVPKFQRIDALDPSRGWLVEYDQETSGLDMPLREKYLDAVELAGLPKDSLLGYEAVELVLTKLLSNG
ncbi:MAG: immunity 26/phosphotriesterase HocA family protein [Bellilinea sp.]|jgi:hypothetical protein